MLSGNKMLPRPSASLGCKETGQTEPLDLPLDELTQERILVHHRGPSVPQQLWNSSSVILPETEAWMGFIPKDAGGEG